MPRKMRTTSKLTSAIEEKNLDDLKRLVRKGMKLNWMLRPRKVLPLVLVAQTGDIEFCRAIVELGVCLDACRGLPSPLNNAIHLYVYFKTAVLTLIRLGCDVNECSLERVWSEKKPMIGQSWLAKSAKPYLSRPTSLGLAILMDDYDAVTILLEAGADINKSSEEDERGFGKTPIHYLCENLSGECNLARIIEYFRLRPSLNPKPDLNRLNNDRETPLVVAVKCRNTEAVYILLEEKVELNCETENNSTALHYAIENSAPDFQGDKWTRIVVALLRAGCAVDMPHWKDSLLNTNAYLNDLICEILVKFGADPLRYNGESNTLLHLGARFGNLILIDMALRAGISVDSASSETRETALMYCQSCLTTAKYLIKQRSARLDLTDSIGDTALHHSCRFGVSGVSAYLIIEGSPRCLDSYHLTETKPRILELLLLTETSQIQALMSAYAATWSRSPLYKLGHVMASYAHSLKHLCRLAIRDALAKHTEGRGILLSTDFLPLPSILKNYICYHEELNRLRLSNILNTDDDDDVNFYNEDDKAVSPQNDRRYHRHRQLERSYD